MKPMKPMKPMDPARLEDTRRYLAGERPSALDGPGIALLRFADLLAAHDYHEQRADVAERERDAWHRDFVREEEENASIAAAVGTLDDGDTLQTVRELTEFGRQWRDDSSLAKWFPLTAERLQEAEAARDFLARLAGSAICRATYIESGERVIEDNAAIAEHALTTAVEALRARAENAESEIARLRARVRVEAEDVERAGVTRVHVEAWLAANGWTTTAHTDGRLTFTLVRPRSEVGGG